MKTRRSFVKSVSVFSACLSTMGPQLLFAENYNRSSTNNSTKKIYIFSKHLQWLSYEKMAEKAKQIGFDGVDLTVRPNGHVSPENVKNDLPKAVKAMKDAGLLADRITTSITDPDDALTIDILETASDMGIKSYRLGWFTYDSSCSVKENLLRYHKKLIKLADINRNLGLTASYQNHAGLMVGGPVWDIGMMLEGIDANLVGVRYDIRHATVEGGTAWPLGMKFLSDKINSLDVKDFIWKEIGGKWQTYNVPLGKGMVDFNRYFQILKESHIKGDFTLHLEYDLGGAEQGITKLSCSPDVVTSAMKSDLLFLRKLL